jgi:DnaK suppressor protein
MNEQATYYQRLSERRRQIQEMRSALERRGLREPFGQAIHELSLYDNHPADIGTETYERERDAGLGRDLERTLKAVDDALARLAAGRYGWCAECGGRVDPRRLDALPEAVLCVECAARSERRGTNSP